MQKNITLKVSAELIQWARRKAADENTSVSKLVGDMLEREMKHSDTYWAAYERFASLEPSIPGCASERQSREQVHERR